MFFLWFLALFNCMIGFANCFSESKSLSDLWYHIFIEVVLLQDLFQPFLLLVCLTSQEWVSCCSHSLKSATRYGVMSACLTWWSWTSRGQMFYCTTEITVCVRWLLVNEVRVGATRAHWSGVWWLVASWMWSSEVFDFALVNMLETKARKRRSNG